MHLSVDSLLHSTYFHSASVHASYFWANPSFLFITVLYGVDFWQVNMRAASGPWWGNTKWSAETHLSAVHDAVFSVVQPHLGVLNHFSPWRCVKGLECFPQASRPIFPRRDHAVWCASGSCIELLDGGKILSSTPCNFPHRYILLIQSENFSSLHICQLLARHYEEHGEKEGGRECISHDIKRFQHKTISDHSSKSTGDLHIVHHSLGLPDPMSHQRCKKHHSRAGRYNV